MGNQHGQRRTSMGRERKWSRNIQRLSAHENSKYYSVPQQTLRASIFPQKWSETNILTGDLWWRPVEAEYKNEPNWTHSIRYGQHWYHHLLWRLRWYHADRCWIWRIYLWKRYSSCRRRNHQSTLCPFRIWHPSWSPREIMDRNIRRRHFHLWQRQ